MKKIILLILILLSLLMLFVHKKEDNVLSFASWGSQSEVKVLNKVISDFEKDNPQIKVNFIHIPQNYYQKIHLLYASGMQPDVIFINNQYIPMYIDAGLLENLTPYFSESEFINEALKAFSDEKGNIYAVPRDISNLVLYCNKEIFKEHKVKFPPQIKDIYELKNLAKHLTNENHWGINHEQEPLYWLYYLASNSSGVLSDDKKSIILNSLNGIETLNFYGDFVNKYKIAPSKAEIGSKTTAQMFINSQLAMYLGGRWMVPKFRQTINFDWDIISFPAKNSKLYSDASGWAVSKNSKNKDAAVKFIKYLSSKETIDKFTQSGLIIPARIDSFDNFILNINKEKPYNTFVYSDMLKYTKPTPVNKNYSEINDILKEKSQQVFDTGENAQKVFDDKTMKRLESLL